MSSLKRLERDTWQRAFLTHIFPHSTLDILYDENAQIPPPAPTIWIRGIDAHPPPPPADNTDSRMTFSETWQPCERD